MDFTTLKMHSGHYITPLFEEKIEDIVWSVQITHDGQTQSVYLYMLEEKGMLAQNLENWIENERRESELNGKFEAALLMIQRFNMSVKDVAEELKIPIKELMERLNQNDTPKS